MIFSSVLILLVLTLQSPAEPVAGDALGIQVTLDRAGFSPGVIDGRLGENTRRAIDAFRREEGREPVADPQPLLDYTITEADIAGPFTQKIPSDLMQQAELPALGYRGPLEALAERFHTTPDFLRELNPESRFAAGERIRVPNVAPFIIPAPRLQPAPELERTKGTSGRASGDGPDAPPGPDKPEVVVSVTESSGVLTVRDSTERVIFHAPVTTGSERDPLPVGEWAVKGVQYSPDFNYNPELFWDANPAHAKAVIPPGPNNPVGVVWIALTKEHYGIHGTPEPAAIGRSESHGCVRLTNWDAVKLAGLVKPGTRVIFVP